MKLEEVIEEVIRDFKDPLDVPEGSAYWHDKDIEDLSHAIAERVRLEGYVKREVKDE